MDRANSYPKKKVLLLGYKQLAWDAFSLVLASSDVEVVGIVTRDIEESSPFWVRVRALNIPVYSSVRGLNDLVFELGISINFWELLKPPFLNRASFGFVNVHHSYNLRFRGRHCTTFAIQRARSDNIWYHGTTLHYISEKLDDGPVIATWACPILELDTAKTLFTRVESLCGKMLTEWLPRVWRESLVPYQAPAEFHTHRNADIQNKLIDVHGDPLDVYDFVRSLTFPPYDPPWCRVVGYRHELFVEPGEGRKLLLDAGGERRVFLGPQLAEIH